MHDRIDVAEEVDRHVLDREVEPVEGHLPNGQRDQGHQERQVESLEDARPVVEVACRRQRRPPQRVGGHPGTGQAPHGYSPSRDQPSEPRDSEEGIEPAAGLPFAVFGPEVAADHSAQSAPARCDPIEQTVEASPAVVVGKAALAQVHRQI